MSNLDKEKMGSIQYWFQHQWFKQGQAWQHPQPAPRISCTATAGIETVL